MRRTITYDPKYAGASKVYGLILITAFAVMLLAFIAPELNVTFNQGARLDYNLVP